MKLIKIVSHIDGREYHSDVFLSFGRSYKLAMDFIENSIPPKQKISEKFKHDGWYVRIELPFKSIQHYTDHNGFHEKEGPCRKVFLIQKRFGIKKILKLSCWFPNTYYEKNRTY